MSIMFPCTYSKWYGAKIAQVVGRRTGGAGSSHTTPSLVRSPLEYTEPGTLAGWSAKKKSDDPQSGYLFSCLASLISD